MILPRYSTVFFRVRLSVQPWISLHFSFTSYTIIKHSTLSGWLLRLRTMKFTSWNLALNIQHACFLTVHPTTGTFSPSIVFWSLCQVATAPPFILPVPPSFCSLLTPPPNSYYLLNSHYYFKNFLSHSPHPLVPSSFSSLFSHMFSLTRRLDNHGITYLPFQYPPTSCTSLEQIGVQNRAISKVRNARGLCFQTSGA